MDEHKVTMHDVARRCGLSVATVSRIISHADYPVSREAREKVLRAVEELHYNPNMLGRYLKFNQSNEVGVIIPHISNYYYTELVAGINDSLLHSGYNVLLCDSCRNSEYEKKQVQYLLQKKVRGIAISTIGQDTDWVRQMVPSTVALVAIEQRMDDKTPFVGLASEESGRMAVRYLYQKGHRKIAFVSAPLTNSRYSRRLDGFIEQIKEYDLPFNPGYFRVADSDRSRENVYEFNIGERIATNMVTMEEPPTAIVCASDMLALGVLRGLHQRGRRVPDDVAVMGFDNLLVTGMTTPTLTTIDQNIRGMGVKAIELLLKVMEHAGSSEMNWISEPCLIERESA